MPGLFGVITRKPAAEAQADINSMLTCVKHEPFYTTGSFSVESQGLYIGWSVHRQSFSDCMPIVDAAHNRAMFFSGYNFPDENLVSALRSHGHEPNFSDASYLLDAYMLEGENFFASLNGWFCGLIVDVQCSAVRLFNDRYGMSRLYIYEAPDGFYFASEAKALLKVRKELRQFDLQSLGEFFACDCVLENRTLFSNVSLLPGGSLWTFEAGRLARKTFYFTPQQWENQEPLPRELFHREVSESFSRLLPLYSQFQKTTAISLTGGLDTRMILAYMNARPGDFPCYTFAGIGKDTFDVKIARKVASACGQTHTTVKLDRDFLADLPAYAEKTIYISDGCHDVCGSHDIYLNSLAREIAPVRLTGKFGSEVLRGVRMLKPQSRALDHLDPVFGPYVDGVAAKLASMGAMNEISFTVFADIPWYEYGRLAVEQSQLTFITPYMDNDLVQLAYRGCNSIKDRDEVPLRGILRHRPELLGIPTDRGYRGGGLKSWVSRYFYGTLLFRADWFFNHMPHRYSKVGGLLEKLRVQDLFLGRHFLTNYRAWFQHDLKDFVRDMLLDPNARVRHYVNGAVLDRMVHSHISGERCYLGEINKALTTELIHRQLIEMA